MTRTIGRKRRVDTPRRGLSRTLPGDHRAEGTPEDVPAVLVRFFFDPIAIDECNRGSAAADSAWREIPEYFFPATRIGLTATPKKTKYVSNIACLGESVHSCALTFGKLMS